MQRNLINSLLALGFVIFIATGCSMLKKDSTSSYTNSSSASPTNATPVTSSNSPDAAPSSKAIAWELGNKISMAAILYDLKGVSTSDSLTKARILANEVGAEVPAFPAKSGDKIKDSAAVLHYLLNDVFKDVGVKVKEKYGAKEAALFETSLKSNVLLLIYGPGGKEGKTVASMIKTNAKIGELPEDLWTPLVAKLENDGSFDDIKDAVLKMQTDVSQYLQKS